jgi:hypothetical protein
MYAGGVQYRLRYNQAVPLDGGEPLSLGSIVDDVLGLPPHNSGRGTYLLWAYARYHPAEQEGIADRAFADSGVFADAGAFFSATSPTNHNTLDALPFLFKEAVEEDATQGRLSPFLASHLARVTRLADRTIEATDLPALAAWALEEKLRGGPVRVAFCLMCGRRWLPDRHAVYCRRPAPDRHLVANRDALIEAGDWPWGLPVATCREVAKQAAYRERHGDFMRERKKLYERARRGTLDANAYKAWLTGNRPGERETTWVSFEDWKAGKRPKGGTTRGKR